MTLPFTGLPEWNGSGANPNQQLENDVNTLYQDRKLMDADFSAIHQAIEAMDAAMKSGDPFMAVMIAMYQVLPAVQIYKGDNVKQLADSENIASDLRNFITGAQDAFNKTDGSGATDLYYYIQDLDGGGQPDSPNNPFDVQVNGKSQSWLEFLSDNNEWEELTGAPAPLDAQDASYLTTSCLDIASQFNFPNASTPHNDWGNFTAMEQDISGWYNPEPPASSNVAGPTPPNPYPAAAPAPQIKAIQGDLQQGNQGVSTLSTTVQTNVQFFTQDYNQYLGVLNNVYQGVAQQEKTLVNNERAN